MLFGEYETLGGICGLTIGLCAMGEEKFILRGGALSGIALGLDSTLLLKFDDKRLLFLLLFLFIFFLI